mgnify:CR=1 FL=1
MRAVIILTSIILVTAVVGVSLGIVDLDNLVNNPSEEMRNIGISIEEFLSPKITTGDGNDNSTSSNTGTSGGDQSSNTGTSNDDDSTTNNDSQADPVWETVSCPEVLPLAPGYEDKVETGWVKMEYPINEEWPYENYKLVMGEGELFALGNNGGLMRLDSGFWNRLDANTTQSLSSMMSGTWPSYFVGNYGTIRSYSPVTSKIENLETPWDSYDVYDRPNLYAAWGSNHENFWVLGDGVMYNYAPLSPSDPNYNASDPGPKWQYHESPVSPWSSRGPYDRYISDVWVNNDDSVFALIGNPGGGQYVTEWDGSEWGEGKSIPTTSLVRDIWGFSHDNIFAVGVAAGIWHYDGVEWTDFENLGLDRWNSYSSIWGTSMSDLWCVGDYGSTSSPLMHWDGTYWSGHTVPDEDYAGLYSIVGFSQNIADVYVSGDYGYILHYIPPTAGDTSPSDLTGIQETWGHYFYDSFSDDSHIYYCGIEENSAFLGRYSQASGLQEFSLNTELEIGAFFSVTVKDRMVYATGRLLEGGLLVVKYNLDTGQTTAFSDVIEGSNLFPDEIIVDDEGMIYIAGKTDTDIEDQANAGFSVQPDESYNYKPYAFDAFLIKYNPQGERQWVRMWGNPDTPKPFSSYSGESVTGIFIDDQGMIVVTGDTDTGNSFTVDSHNGEIGLNLSNMGDEILGGYWYWMSFDSDGTIASSNGWTSGGRWNIMGYSDMSSDGNLYLVGTSDYRGIIAGQQGTLDQNQVIIKLDQEYAIEWLRYLSLGRAGVSDCAVDDEGVYIVGSTWSSVGGQNHYGYSDMYITHLRQDGLILGSETLGGSDSDYPNLIELSPSGTPVVWGSTYSSELLGGKEGPSFILWEVGAMMIDQYAECRLP